MTQARDLADGKFDTNTLVVDAANNRVGVGTTTPADHLAVVTSGANAQLSVDRSDGATGRTVLIHSSSGGQLQTTGSAPLILGTADTERGRFLSGGGLTFNGDTASANALNDYEEGTWTATFLATTTNPTVNSVGNNVGRYIKIGSVVYFGLYTSGMNISNAGSGGAQIGGLPYTAAGGTNEYYVFNYKHGSAVGNSSEGGYIVNGNTKMQFTQPGTTSSAAWLTGNPRYVMVSGFYKVI